MDQPNKLPLVKASMRMLLDELNERDTVSIVVYAGDSGLALAPTSCERKREIADAIDRLSAGGSTNGASGLTLAYETAALHFVPGGSNRVVLCTDGDWNVGVTSRDDLWKMIAEKAKSGVYLSVLGFGMGNYKDDMLEQLADRGNGNHGYVDSTREAHRLLVEDAGGTLVTVAKDVKLQVEWNPATVAGYRLVGYENRRLADRDFKDDAKDAGEMGAGHTVTALYEVVPAGQEVAEDAATADVDPLKYQRIAPGAVPTGSGEMLTVRLRYKEPDASSSVALEKALTDGGAALATASADLRFAAAVAEFALLLRRSPQKGDATFESVLALAGGSLGADAGGWRHEFLDLVAKARTITGQ
jgi:Ca-activated chloride channel family protein